MSRGLELVRRLARIGERVARRDLAAAALALRQGEERAVALGQEARRKRETIAARAAEGAEGAELGAGYGYVRAVEARAAEAEAACDALRAELARREAAWVETRRTERGIGAVCERRARKALQLRERREQQATDDLVNAWGGNADAR